jgi:hypothetical protein
VARKRDKPQPVTRATPQPPSSTQFNGVILLIEAAGSRALAERYAAPSANLAQQLEALASRVEPHLARMGFHS